MARRERSRPRVSQGEYEALAAFRHALNRFLAFSTAAARGAGLTPRQHQALLAIKGAPGGRPVTIGDLANRLLIRHHSAVGLVDRLARLGHVARKPAPGDRRLVNLVVAPSGRRVLERLSAAHREELRQVRRPLAALLESLTSRSRATGRRARSRRGRRPARA